MTVQFPPTPPLDTDDLTPDELRDARERDSHRAHNARIIREAALHAARHAARLNARPACELPDGVTEEEHKERKAWEALLRGRRDIAAAENFVAQFGRFLLSGGRDESLLARHGIVLAAEVCALREELELEHENNEKVAVQNDQLELALAQATQGDDAREQLLHPNANVRAPMAQREPTVALARAWAKECRHRQYLVVGGGPDSLEAHFTHYEITELANILAARHMHLVSDATGIYACNNTEPA
jgi:hypothetical protein